MKGTHLVLLQEAEPAHWLHQLACRTRDRSLRLPELHENIVCRASGRSIPSPAFTVRRSRQLIHGILRVYLVLVLA